MNYEKDEWELYNFAELKTQVYKVAFYYTKNHDIAEDIVQETFLKALISMQSIREESKFKQWLLTVAKRKAIDHLRRQSDYGDFPEIGSGNVEQIVLDRIFENEFKTAISKFRSEIRSVLILKIQHDLSDKAISKILEIPIGTVKSRIFYAKKKLRAFYYQYFTGEVRG